MYPYYFDWFMIVNVPNSLIQNKLNIKLANLSLS